MSTLFSIEPASMHDIDAVSALLSELNIIEGYPMPATAEAVHASLLDKRVEMRALVAKQNGIVIGVALYYWGCDTVSASYGYHLADIIVTKEHRNKGIGKRLFAALAKQCLAEKGQWFSLTVLKKNEAAQRFYKQCGMVEVAVDFYGIGPQGLSRIAS